MFYRDSTCIKININVTASKRKPSSASNNAYISKLGLYLLDAYFVWRQSVCGFHVSVNVHSIRTHYNCANNNITTWLIRFMIERNTYAVH